MIPKSGHRFSDQIMRQQKENQPDSVSRSATASGEA
jgi:hypothetical protein